MSLCYGDIHFFLQNEARVAWISSDCFESFSPLIKDVTEGVITTQSNRMKFRLSKYFSVHQFASPVYFSQPASADQIWKILSTIPLLTLTILCHWRHFEDCIQKKWRDSQAGWVWNECRTEENGERVQVRRLGRFDVDMQILKKGGKVYSTGPLMRTLFRTFQKRRQKMENSSVIKSSNNKTTSPTMMNSPSKIK